MGKGEAVFSYATSADWSMLLAVHRMSGTPKNAQAQTSSEEVLIPAIARLGLPVLIFGASFLLLSVALTYLVSPDRFPVRMGDKIVRLADVQAEEYALSVKQADLLDERAKILRDSDAPVLTQVMKLRSAVDPIGTVLLEIDRVRASFRNGNIDPVSLPLVQFDGSSHTLTLGGTVTDPGGRSVSILSSFVDELRKIPMLQSENGRTPVTDPPEYVQHDAPGGGTISPFTVVITIPHAQ